MNAGSWRQGFGGMIRGISKQARMTLSDRVKS
jgi:hypothetical protein